MAPRILIPTPTSFDEPYNQQCWPEYAAAIAAAGAEPVRVPLNHSAAELEALAQNVDGILLPGSPADVDPALYGHARQPACEPADPRRQATDRALLETAERSKIPLLGICMGLQTMNTYCGGTLIQDLDPIVINHGAGRAVQTAHSAAITADSRLHTIVSATAEFTPGTDRDGRILVNSSHHQAIDIPGEGLQVTARCPQDHVIEAVEGTDPAHWLVGVQWHPERTVHSSAASAALFKAFIEACDSRVRVSR